MAHNFVSAGGTFNGSNGNNATDMASIKNNWMANGLQNVTFGNMSFNTITNLAANFTQSFITNGISQFEHGQDFWSTIGIGTWGGYMNDAINGWNGPLQ